MEIDCTITSDTLLYTETIACTKLVCVRWNRAALLVAVVPYQFGSVTAFCSRNVLKQKVMTAPLMCSSCVQTSLAGERFNSQWCILQLRWQTVYADVPAAEKLRGPKPTVLGVAKSPPATNRKRRRVAFSVTGVSMTWGTLGRAGAGICRRV